MSLPTINVCTLQIAGTWLFLAPLIVILGTVDVLTNGRSRNWPFGDSRVLSD
ncbi:hypothetical protein [Devosia nitrariae]|uniref:hypothetical protein n=1 Tax=Devosia nitrariae TaxID=2071872 RepID=UPI0024E09773|nr:hypothetical protein [Devosia nitrariae]